jgi:hypothetical protein
MSEVIGLLTCYWLEKLGHEVSVLVEAETGKSTLHFDVVTPSQFDTRQMDIDAVMLFKIHGMKLAQRTKLFRYNWKRIVMWADAMAPERIIAGNVKRLTRIAWGTPEILAGSVSRYPWADHCLCEHATVFTEPPELSETTNRGLYAGRLPVEYLEPLKAVGQVSPMLAVCLWIQDVERKQQILLRPSQATPEGLERARQLVPSLVEFRPGVNMLNEAAELSRAAFGLCPSTKPAGEMQLSSACKFYDYLALGLPVVMANNVPEARYVQKYSILGRLYQQGNVENLQSAAAHALGEVNDIRRKMIQDWVFTNATYKRRAETLDRFLLS